jgi:hypothetical protein
MAIFREIDPTPFVSDREVYAFAVAALRERENRAVSAGDPLAQMVCREAWVRLVTIGDELGYETSKSVAVYEAQAKGYR